jgi:hypothetical protein
MALRKLTIERAIPTTDSFEPEQLRGAAATVNEILRQLWPNIQWLEAYVANEKTFRVYLANDESVILKHAMLDCLRPRRTKPSKE